MGMRPFDHVDGSLLPIPPFVSSDSQSDIRSCNDYAAKDSYGKRSRLLPAPRSPRRVSKHSFTCFMGWFFVAIASSVSTGQDLPAPEPLHLFEPMSLEERVETLTEAHRNLREKLDRALKDNEALSERLNTLEPLLLRDEGANSNRSNSLSGLPKLSEGSEKPAKLKKDEVPSGDSGAVYCSDYGLKSLFDSFNIPGKKSKPWYEKMTIRGYSQIRFGRSVQQAPESGPPSLLGDRSIGQNTGTFSIRRARLILSEEVSDHLLLYFQSDFANNPADGTNTFFAQIRDLYGDIYLTTDKVHRLRMGQSKLPWGFEEMQSSSNRIPLDRSDAIDSGDSPNQRDLGAFYYWTPVEKQKLLKELVDGGLKGSGNYGVFAFGVYNGQGGSELDQNKNLHSVARFTWPFQLASGQAVEMSIQGYTGKFVPSGTPINPLGLPGAAVTPAGVGGDGILEQRVAGSFVWYPQPWGFQTEWNVGQGPGLNNTQTAIESRNLEGGYFMSMYKIDTPCHGIFIPYARYQHYKGGYRSIANAPYGIHDEYDMGVEWQIRKELELVVEYGFVNGVSLATVDGPGVPSYTNYLGQILRCQLQINY